MHSTKLPSLTEMKRDCCRCIHVSEDIVGGTNQLFCNNPDIDWFPNESLALDPNTAKTCQAYELDVNPGLYFHELT